MEHTTRDNKPKIVNQCSFPLTAPNCVDDIVTDIAVIKVTTQGLFLMEAAQGWSPEDVQTITEPELIVSDNFRPFQAA
jgi:acyl CoA:acetate/3-ketoacid CoA transferase beta subunit